MKKVQIESQNNETGELPECLFITYYHLLTNAMKPKDDYSEPCVQILIKVISDRINETHTRLCMK